MDMKKNITIISLSLLLVYLLFTNNTIVSTSILNSCHLFLTKVFISLFPMYIISKILINYNFQISFLIDFKKLVISTVIPV